MDQKPTQGRIILYRTGERRYSPALINRVNEDGSCNLTVFGPQGDTSLASTVHEGDKVGQWAWPGVDANEKAAEDEQKRQAEAAQKSQAEDSKFKSTLGAERKPVEVSKKS